MEGVGRWGGAENALSMAACSPSELFTFGPSGGGGNWVLSTTGDTGGSSLTRSGEGGGHAVKAAGSGEVELPGVGSCECSSVVRDEVPVMGTASDCG